MAHVVAANVHPPKTPALPHRTFRPDFWFVRPVMVARPTRRRARWRGLSTTVAPAASTEAPDGGAIARRSVPSVGSRAARGGPSRRDGRRRPTVAGDAARGHPAGAVLQTVDLSRAAAVTPRSSLVPTAAAAIQRVGSPPPLTHPAGEAAQGKSVAAGADSPRPSCMRRVCPQDGGTPVGSTRRFCPFGYSIIEHDAL